MEQKDISEVIGTCFRKPLEGESWKRMSSTQIRKHSKKYR